MLRPISPRCLNTVRADPLAEPSERHDLGVRRKPSPPRACVFVGGMGAPWVGELFAFRFRGSGLQIGLGKGNSP